jgi:hypothetical protein
MSKYAEIATTVRNQAYLVAALAGLGYKPEIHVDGAALVGYLTTRTERPRPVDWSHTAFAEIGVKPGRTVENLDSVGPSPRTAHMGRFDWRAFAGRALHGKVNCFRIRRDPGLSRFLTE